MTCFDIRARSGSKDGDAGVAEILQNIISFEERPHVRSLFGIASYHKEKFYNTVIKTSEEWDAIPTDEQTPMAASMTPQTGDRICFKFQTNDCLRPKCPFIHKIMNNHRKGPEYEYVMNIKDQNYIAKVPEKKNFLGRPIKGNIPAKKFKGEPDLRFNNSKGTNGMHNNIPLTKEHQMVLGEGEAKSTPSNPRGFSKRQLNVLSFLRNREIKNNINQSNDDGYISSWENEKNSFTGIEHNYKNGFNLNIFQPSENEDTPTRESNRNAVEESTLVKTAVGDIKRLTGEVPLTDIVVYSNTMHINRIGKLLLLGFQGRINPWSTMNLTLINMIGWHQLSSDLPKGFHEGSDEVMLALYKINEVIFNSTVVYPYKIRNIEYGKYEYKKNSFMRFIPHERNKHDKIFN